MHTRKKHTTHFTLASFLMLLAEPLCFLCTNFTFQHACTSKKKLFKLQMQKQSKVGRYKKKKLTRKIVVKSRAGENKAEYYNVLRLRNGRFTSTLQFKIYTSVTHFSNVTRRVLLL